MKQYEDNVSVISGEGLGEGEGKGERGGERKERGGEMK